MVLVNDYSMMGLTFCQPLKRPPSSLISEKSISRHLRAGQRNILIISSIYINWHLNILLINQLEVYFISVVKHWCRDIAFVAVNVDKIF